MILTTSCAVLTALAGFYVLLPLFRGSGDSLDIDLMAETEMDRLLQRKAAIYRNIKDLQLEYRMGRLSDEDFGQLEAGYKIDAAAILQKLDRIGVSEGLDAAIENEIALKKGAAAAGESGQPEGAAQCPSCGAAVIPGKKFCADCGHKL